MVEEVEVPLKDSLSDEELTCVRQFLKKARELHSTHLISRGESGISLNVASELGKAVQFRVSLPSEDHLRSLYMAFRFFYLEKEKSNFLRVSNIIKRRTDSLTAKQYIDRLKEMWSGALAVKQMQLRVNGEQITPSALVDLWFNAHYFHSDSKKEEDLTNLTRILTIDVCRFMLADAVYEASKAVLLLANALTRLEQ